MSKYINVYFTSIPNPELIQLNTETNELLVDTNSDYYHDASANSYVLKYKLRENETIDKFLNLTEPILQNTNYRISYNNYESYGYDSQLEARRELNNLIDRINQNNWLTISDDLKIDVSSEDTQHEKLNELHFLFEKKRVLVADALSENRSLINALESLNQLIHQCENGLIDDKRVYQVLRLDQQNDIQVKMEDDDYNRMRLHQFGTVQLDFATVGKDLGDAFYANDIDLVRNREIKQQLYITPYISLVFDGDSDEDGYKAASDDYKEWCINNNVGDYYAFTLPKYNLGRVILGDWVDKDTKNIDDVIDIRKRYPYLLDIKIEDE